MKQKGNVMDRRIRLKCVNPHIICCLCKGYMINATTITECLHTCEYWLNNSFACVSWLSSDLDFDVSLASFGAVTAAGNLAADTAAKAALLIPVSTLLYWSEHTFSEWLSSWSLETWNELHAIEPIVNITKPYRLPHRDEIVIHWLRNGHFLDTY